MEYIGQILWHVEQGGAQFLNMQVYFTNIIYNGWKQCPREVLFYLALSPFFELFSFQEQSIQGELLSVYQKESRLSSKLRRKH